MTSRLRHVGWWAASVLAGALACTGKARPPPPALSSASSASASSATPASPPLPALCPDCAPSEDETGIIACDRGGCVKKGAEVGPEETSSLGFPASRVLPFIAGERTLPVKWTLRHRRDVSGFVPETSVRVNVVVSKILHLPEVRLCPAQLQVVADVAVSTLDGAFSGTFRDVVFDVHSKAHATVRETADLRSFAGNLKLPVDASRARRGTVMLSLDVRPGRFGGELGFFLVFFDPPAGGGKNRDPERILRLDDLEAQWPRDGCGWHEVPVLPDDRPEVLGGRSVQDVFDDTRALVLAANPIRASSIRAAATVHVEPFELQSACMLPPDGARFGIDEPSFTFTSGLRVRTGDGRLDWKAERFVSHARTDLRGKVLSALIQHEGDAIDVSEFAAATGFRGVNFRSSPCAAFRFSAFYEPPKGGRRVRGEIKANGLPCGSEPGEAGITLDHLAWCFGPDCAPGPRARSQ